LISRSEINHDQNGKARAVRTVRTVDAGGQALTVMP